MPAYAFSHNNIKPLKCSLLPSSHSSKFRQTPDSSLLYVVMRGFKYTSTKSNNMMLQGPETDFHTCIVQRIIYRVCVLSLYITLHMNPCLNLSETSDACNILQSARCSQRHVVIFCKSLLLEAFYIIVIWQTEDWKVLSVKYFKGLRWNNTSYDAVSSAAKHSYYVFSPF